MAKIRLPTHFEPILLNNRQIPIISDKPVIYVPTTIENHKVGEKQFVIPTNTGLPIFDNEYCDIAFLSNAYPYYSGGRYYDFMIHLMLRELGYKCILYTNLEPKFTYDFDFYKKSYHKIADVRMVSLPCANSFWGTPLSGAVRALELGSYYDKPVRISLYDCPIWLLENTFIGEYHGRHEILRSIEFKHTLHQLLHKIPDLKILVLTENAIEPWSKWLNLDIKYFNYFNPVVNTRIIDSINDSIQNPWFLSVNRNDFRKSWDEVFRSFAPYCDNHELFAITNHLTGFQDCMTTYRIVPNSVHFYTNVPDFLKFSIAKRCKAIISASHFEGFGMWMAEGLRCGIPVVCYDLEALSGIQHPHLYKAKLHDFTDFQSKVDYLVKSPPIRFDPVKDFDFDIGKIRLHNIVDIPEKIILDFDNTEKPEFNSVSTIFHTEPAICHFNSIYKPETAVQQTNSIVCWRNLLSHIYYNKPNTHFDEVKDQITIFTFSTSPRFTILESCCKHLGITLSVIRPKINGKWRHYDRLSLMLSELNTIKTPYALHMDADDSIVIGDLRNLFNVLEIQKCKVIFSGEIGCHPESNDIEVAQKALVPNQYKQSPFTNLCAAITFGYIDNLRDVWEQALKKERYPSTNPGDIDSDQGRLNQAYIDKFPEVQLDWYSHVIYCNDYLTDASKYLRLII